MKKNKGFTLIELLAVIVILAIIALIAVPVVMNIIGKANKAAFKDSAYGIVKAGEYFYTDQLLLNAGLAKEKTFTFPNDIEGLEIKGSKPTHGYVTVNKKGQVEIAISNGKWCATKGFEEDDVTISDDLENCNILGGTEKEKYKEVLLNGADPVLKTGMIPVIIEPNGKVLKADDYTEWYNYEDKVWANAVTVTEASREKYQDMRVGEEIKEEDILTYFVWIPRYKYKLWYVEAIDSDPTNNLDTSKRHSIDIVFENKDTEKSEGTSNGEYLTHPAFTFGEEELNGIWVGKFETGYSGATNKDEAKQAIGDSSKVIIKPNTYSWRNISISNMFYTALAMNDNENLFGLSIDSDTHMMKNTEWGAVAYLSHSKYGTCVGEVCSKVYINNYKDYMTGCGADSEYQSSVDVCLNAYGSKESGTYNQSTTGNISGVFDMSGGTTEYVMGYTTGAKTKYGASNFTDANFPTNSKYVDIYNTTVDLQLSERILGDATGEMGPFYFNNAIGSWGDYSAYISATFPWFTRGKGAGGTAGIFAFGSHDGSGTSGRTYRCVCS